MAFRSRNANCAGFAMNRYKLQFTALLLLPLLFLVGCGIDSLSGDDEASTGILRLGNGAEPQGLDPHLITGFPEFRILRSLYQGLIRLDPKTLEPLPAAASSWEIEKEGTLYRFHLDPEGRWSNGDPVTADDFVASFQRILTPALGAVYAYQLFVVENAREWHAGEIEDFGKVGFRVVDEHTLEIRLRAPVPYFLSLLVNPAWYPLHRDSIETYDNWISRAGNWTRPGRKVSNGPFLLERWKLNAYIQVVSNPHFNGSDRYHIDEIFFFPITNAYTEERSFLDGLLDVTTTVPTQRIHYYLEGGRTDLLRVDPDLGVYYLLINTDVEPLNDPRVREALSLTIDRVGISRDIRRRGEPPARSFTPPGTGGYTAEPMLFEDADRARELLAEAGFPEGRGFPRIEFLFNTSETHRPIAEAIQEKWRRELGIRIDLVNKEWNSYLTDRSNRDFQIARAGWLGDYLDPDTFLGLWTSTTTNNFSGWSHPDFDRYLERANLLPDGEERWELLAKAEEILMREVAVLPIFFYNRAYLKQPTVMGWPRNILGYTDYSGIKLQ